MEDESARPPVPATASATQSELHGATATASGLGYQGGVDRAGYPQAALRLVLPQLPGATPPQRAGPGRGRPGGLCQRRVDPQGRSAGGGPRAGGCIQGPGVQALPRPGRAGHRLRRAALGERLPYLWLDAKVEKVRAGGRVEHRALVVAYGVDATGQREVLGIDVGAAETEAFWGESCVRWSAAAFGASSWWSPTPTRASSRPSPRC
jgi:Transposase, Mutator family